MDKNYVISNWDKFYKNYSKNNPDLLLNGISTKRALLNHYMKYGINENRKIFDNDNDNDNIVIINNDNIGITANDNIIITNNNNNNNNNNNISETKENIFILNELMIIEKLDN
jgi:hypothetical protein